jgi:hypothetical protein
MSGQPTPPRLLQAFGTAAIGDDITDPIPQPSQISINPGAASLNDGFPPACFQDPADGGVLPSGADFNGILFMISAIAAALWAGQRNVFDSTLATFMGGYKLGAKLAQVASPGATWTNLVDGNTTDPDAGGAGWLSSEVVYTAVALTGVNNVVLPGPSDYIFDVDCTAGAIAYTGFVAQRDGQRLTFRKSDVSANGLSIVSQSGSSTAANRCAVVAPSLGAPLQYMDFTIRYVQTLARWIQA